MEGKNNEYKKTKTSTIVIIILLFTGVFIGSFLLGVKDGMDKEKKKSNESSNKVESNSNTTSNEVSNVTSNETSNEVSNTPTSNSNTNTNTNVVSSELQKDITKKVALLFNDTKYKSGKSIKGQTQAYTLTTLLSNNLSLENKLNIVLTNMNASYKKTLSESEAKASDVDVLKDKAGKHDFYSADTVKKNFKKLFGFNPTLNDVNECPSYYYSKKENAYVSIEECGYGGLKTAYGYVDSIYKSGKEIRAKVYVGSVFSNASGEVYYNDINQNKKNKTSKFNAITDSNKKNFTSYTFVFVSDSNGNYYYNNIVK